jgi:hypothetical protein
MKKTLPILSIAIVIAGLFIALTSCQSRTADSRTASAIDTTGLAQFQSWKAINQGYNDAIATKPVTRTRVVYQPSYATVPKPVSQPVKKKGWSSAAKGTVIGTSAGAIAGAIINKKNRLVGGIVGGVLGGGAGYGIGRSIDKKNGR